MFMTDRKRGDKHRCIPSMLVALLLIVVAPISAHAGDWKIFRDSNERIQFLSIGTPEKRQIGGSETTKIIWHFGYLEDGTNGYIDATRLIQGSLANFDVVKQAMDLRQGIEGSGKTKVIAEKQVSVAGRSAIEFQTETVISNGTTWYGMLRMVVFGDTLYTLGITAPGPLRLQEDQVKAFLASLKKFK